MKRRRAPLVTALALVAILGTLIALATALVTRRADNGGHRHAASPVSRSARPTPTAAAARFVIAYLRYLDGIGSSSTLPAANDHVRRLAADDGRVPENEWRGRLALTAFRVDQAVGQGVVTATFAAHDRSHTLIAQLTLTRAAGSWWVTGFTPPDLPTAFAPPVHTPRPKPTGLSLPATALLTNAPRGPKAAARSFFNSYLRFTYGHGNTNGLEDVTASLRRRLAAAPPRVPPTIKALRPVVGSLSLEHAEHGGWTALAAINDGQQSYVISLTIKPVNGGWAAEDVR